MENAFETTLAELHSFERAIATLPVMLRAEVQREALRIARGWVSQLQVRIEKPDQLRPHGIICLDLASMTRRMGLEVAVVELNPQVKANFLSAFSKVLDPVQTTNYKDNIDVQALEMSIRTSNVLKDNNIKWMHQLTQMTEQDLLKFDNFGRKSLNELKGVMAQFGLHLASKSNGGVNNQEILDTDEPQPLAQT